MLPTWLGSNWEFNHFALRFGVGCREADRENITKVVQTWPLPDLRLGVTARAHLQWSNRIH